MKKIGLLAISLFAFLQQSVFGFDKDFELLFPESPSIYAYIKDVQAIDQLDEDHPFVEFLNHEAIDQNLPQILFGQLYQVDVEDEEDKADKALEFLENHCHGRMAFGIEELMQMTQAKVETQKSNVKATASASGSSVKASFIMDNKSDLKDIKADLKDLLELKNKKWQENEFENTTYFHIKKNKSSEFYLCVLDDLIVLASQEDMLIDIIGRIKKPNKSKTLLDNQKFMDSISTYSDTDAFLYFNLEEIYDQLLYDKDTSLLNKIDENPMMRSMVSTDAIKNDLHLDALSSIFMTGKIIDEGLEYKFGFTVKSHQGIAKLFSYDDKAPEIPEYVNEAYKAISVSSYDFSTSFNELENMFNKVSPASFMMAKMQLGNLYDEIKSGLIDNLEPYSVTLLGHADNANPVDDLPSNAIVLKVKDTQQAADLLNNLVAKTGFKVKEEEFLGHRVYQINPMALFPMSPSKGQNDRTTYLSLVDHYLVFVDAAEEDFFRNVISQIEKPGRNIKSHGALQDMWDYLPDGEVSMDYTDIAQSILNVYYTKKKQNEMLVKNGTMKKDELEELEKPKTEDLHYSAISKSYLEKYLWYTHVLLFKYDPLED